jgi:endonuclease/exonuclease/phosphatase family metal-dependent hydrolase
MHRPTLSCLPLLLLVWSVLLLGLLLAWPGVAGCATLRIATFNIAWLANEPLPDMAAVAACQGEASRYPALDSRPTPRCRQGVFRTAGAYRLLARSVAALHADVLAVQEVEGDAALAQVLGVTSTWHPRLPTVSATDVVAPIQESGDWWWVTNPLPRHGKQRVALAVRRSVVRSIQAISVPELGAPLHREARGGLLVQLTPINGEPFQVLVLHLKSGCRGVGLTDTTDPACQQLAAQGKILASLLRQWRAQKVPMILLGDFNRAFDEEPKGVACPSLDQPCVSLWARLTSQLPANAEPELLTRGFRQPWGCYSSRYGRAPIDHILLTGGLRGHALPESLTAEPFLDPTHPGQLQAYAYRFLSDHCPLRVDLTWP